MSEQIEKSLIQPAPLFGTTGKRLDYISWEEYFMGVCFLSSQRSKDPSTRHGCCVVNNLNHIVSVGYNGMPEGCDDDDFPWQASSSASESDTKYPYVIHSEQNALDQAGSDETTGATMYLWSERGYLPCSACAKTILNKRISHLVVAWVGTTGSQKFNPETAKPTLRMFAARGVTVHEIGWSASAASFDKIAKRFGDAAEMLRTKNA
jgi:dCMP deaminase